VKVQIKDCCYGDMKEVTFNGRLMYKMPATLAKSLKTRLDAMEQFKHGILLDGKVLTAMFRDEGDRNVALSELDATEPGRLTAFSVEDK